MDKMKIRLLRENAAAPVRATEGSAGYDLRAAVDGPVRIEPGKTAMIPTGIAIELPRGYAAFIFARSGLASRHGIAPGNAVGVVDSDYRGEIAVGLTCHHTEGYTIQPGERIAQMVIMPVETPELIVCEELGGTQRGDGGFGSTGKL